MPTFLWEGRDRTGSERKGAINAPSSQDAREKLQQQGIQVTKLQKKGVQKGFDIGRYVPFLGGVPKKNLVIFTRQFATMIDSGLPLVQALDLLAQQEPHKGFKKIITEIKEDVEAGSTFADALSKHKRVFDDLYVALVSAGELGGVLDTILNRLATYIEKALKLAQEVKGAMVYPAVLVAVSIIITIVMLWKVIPVFKKMFSSMGGAALPAPTQFVINLSQFVQNYIVFMFLGAVGLYVAWTMFARSKRGKEIIDTALLKMPIIGPLMRKVAVAKFTRTMGTMLASGVPILDALDVVARSSGNYVIETALFKVRDKIAEGRNMADPLKDAKVFPDMVVQMIAVGEQTGAMDTMLQKIADFYEDEVDAGVSALTGMLEPIMMVVLGGLLGGLMIAMYMPIFSMAGNVHG